MAKYKKCPRCGINYILEDEDLCDECIAELKGISLDEDLDLEDEDEELCPLCKKSPVADGEKYCSVCLNKLGRVGDAEAEDESEASLFAWTEEGEEDAPSSSDDDITALEYDSFDALGDEDDMDYEDDTDEVVFDDNEDFEESDDFYADDDDDFDVNGFLDDSEYDDDLSDIDEADDDNDDDDK